MQEAGELILAASAVSMNSGWLASTDGEVSLTGTTGGALTAAETGEGDGPDGFFVRTIKVPSLTGTFNTFWGTTEVCLTGAGWLTGWA